MPTSKSTNNPNEPNQAPTREPNLGGAGEEQISAGAQSRPRDLSPEEMSAFQGGDPGSSAPSLTPPQGVAGVTAVTAVVNDKRIVGLWGINQDRNSWVLVDGVGWRKLVNSSASATMALTTLAAHARTLNRRVDYREEADGMIYEMYVW